MPQSIIPTQIGSTPHSSSTTSKVVIGRDETLTWEAAGIGENGRPDNLEFLIINITNFNAGAKTKVAQILLNVGDIMSIFNLNPKTVPAMIDMRIREVSCCEINDQTGEAEERKMMIVASQTYAAPPTT